ncbi:MAG: hypothetical protein ACRBFS_11280 [Aureispira sp.]
MVETIMRTQAAVTALPFIQDDKEGLLSEWLKQMLFPMNPILHDSKLALATDIATTSVRCYADNAVSTLQQQLSEFMKASGFKEIETKILDKVVKEVPEGRLQAWLELSHNNGQETGWVMDGVFPLTTALALVPKGIIKDRLTAWYARFDANACVRVGRSIAGNRYTVLHTELFGKSIQDDMDLYNDLMQTLELSPLPDPLLALLLEENPTYMELVFWLGSGGVLKAGLQLPNPSEDLVRQIALAYYPDTGDALAAFEGAAGAEEPSALLVARQATGVTVEVVY